MIYTVDVDCDYLAEVVFVSKVTPLPSHLSILSSLEGNYYAHLRCGELYSCMVEYLHNLHNLHNLELCTEFINFSNFKSYF